LGLGDRVLKKRVFVFGGMISAIVVFGMFTHRIYYHSEFSNPRKQCSNARISARLLPNCIDSIFTTTCGTPYELIAAIVPTVDSVEMVKLNLIQIKTSKGKLLYEAENIPLDCKVSKLTNEFTCYYIVPEISLPFDELQILFVYTLTSPHQQKSFTDELILKPEYSKEHANDFWDIIMSV
jgi:hypothetical protein